MRNDEIDARTHRDRGSALLMAVFVLVLLTGMGTALLFLSRNEVRMSQSSLNLKRAFYLAESGIEDGRVTLFLANGDDSFDDDLTDAAGVDGVFDLDPTTLQAVYDSNGNVTAFTGFDDDVPVRSWTSLNGAGEPGWYAAFLTNDPVDWSDPLVDSNRRVMITAIGADRNGAAEVVQAIIRPYQYLPDAPAAAITLLGPNPSFDNGPSAVQSHTGNDCGLPGGPFAPIVGTVSSSASALVKANLNGPEDFSSGPLPFEGEDTIGNLTDLGDLIVGAAGHGTIDPFWEDCAALKEKILELAIVADYYCNSDLGSCTFPTTQPDSVVFIDGDLAGTPAGTFSGILVVTGELIYNGNTGWDGIILVIGEGAILRNGGGGGIPTGAVVVANIDPTPDGPNVDKSDWCSSGPDGFGQADYEAQGGGNATVEWCTASIDTSNSIRTYRVTEFLQY